MQRSCHVISIRDHKILHCSSHTTAAFIRAENVRCALALWSEGIAVGEDQDRGFSAGGPRTGLGKIDLNWSDGGDFIKEFSLHPCEAQTYQECVPANSTFGTKTNTSNNQAVHKLEFTIISNVVLENIKVHTSFT
eukprot:3526215-Rhodomonas_salina.1